MLRLFAFTLLLAVGVSTSHLCAQPIGEAESRTNRALAVNTAMLRSKEHLAQNRPAEAVALLESQVLYANANPAFLNLLKEAYLAYYKQLQQTGGASDRIDHVRRQLRILDPRLTLPELGETPRNVAIPEGPKQDAPPLPNKIIPAVAVVEADDPFQQVPLDRVAPAAKSRRSGSPDLCKQAAAAFENGRYLEAAELFKEADEARLELTAEERSAWAYSRLHVLATRFNQSSGTSLSFSEMEREAKAAMALGGKPVQAFGEKVLAAIQKRSVASSGMGQPRATPSALPEGWQALETTNFRVLSRDPSSHANEVIKKAEELRSIIFREWTGTNNAPWSIRCDIHLHTSVDEYVRATRKAGDLPGHASVGIKDNAIVARRIDLRLDDPGFLDVTLPHEVAYIVISDLFVEQPLPRWAEVGMTVLAQPPSQIARYTRAVPKLIQERKLLPPSAFLKMVDFPQAEQITPFYVQSVAVVDYLVKLKGAQTFALYLREAPRRGYEEALTRYYGIRDANDLHDRILKDLAVGK